MIASWPSLVWFQLVFLHEIIARSKEIYGRGRGWNTETRTSFFARAQITQGPKNSRTISPPNKRTRTAPELRAAVTITKKSGLDRDRDSTRRYIKGAGEGGEFCTGMRHMRVHLIPLVNGTGTSGWRRGRFQFEKARTGPIMAVSNCNPVFMPDVRE